MCKIEFVGGYLLFPKSPSNNIVNVNFILLGALQKLYSNFVFRDTFLGVKLIYYGPFGCHELCALVILWLFSPLPILSNIHL
jgi:hypothetical protein